MNTDEETYSKLVTSYNEEIDKLLSDSQEKLLSKLQISKEILEDSIISLME